MSSRELKFKRWIGFATKETWLKNLPYTLLENVKKKKKLNKEQKEPREGMPSLQVAPDGNGKGHLTSLSGWGVKRQLEASSIACK